MATKSPYPDSAVVFALLLILLGAFGVLLIGGIAWHYARARRRAYVSSAMAARVMTAQWAGGEPRIWEVFVSGDMMQERAAMDKVRTGICVLARHFLTLFVLKPLACRRYAPPTVSPLEIDTTDPLIYTPDVNLWELIKFTYRTFRFPWQPSRRPAPPPSQSHKIDPPGDTSDAEFEDLSQAEVTVILSMPLQNRTLVDEGLAEYMLGTAHIELRRLHV